jgi:hypothetical protein
MVSGTELVTFEAAQELERRKIEAIELLDNEQKLVLKDALKYQVIPYFPINQEFIQKYVLNDVEYPSIEGKISQAATEMKSRLGNLIQKNYGYIHALMDLEVAELDLQDLEEELAELKKNVGKEVDGKKIKESDIQRKQIHIVKKKMDIQNRQFGIAGAKNGMEACYKEFLNWKNTIETYVEELRKEDPTIKDHNDLDWDAIRCAEMELKIQKWQRDMMLGKDPTPSQKVLIEAEREKNETSNN